MTKAPLIVAGFVFALVAIAHLSRLIYHFPITIDTIFVPYWINVVGLIISLALAYWMFITAKDA